MISENLFRKFEIFLLTIPPNKENHHHHVTQGSMYLDKPVFI